MKNESLCSLYSNKKTILNKKPTNIIDITMFWYLKNLERKRLLYSYSELILRQYLGQPVTAL